MKHVFMDIISRVTTDKLMFTQLRPLGWDFHANCADSEDSHQGWLLIKTVVYVSSHYQKLFAYIAQPDRLSTPPSPTLRM